MTNKKAYEKCWVDTVDLMIRWEEEGIRPRDALPAALIVILSSVIKHAASRESAQIFMTTCVKAANDLNAGLEEEEE